MEHAVDVAIIGAGPYGLSIAAHLRASGVQFRIFGDPMQTWRDRMPKDMTLKSEGFASNLYDPARALTLEEFCAGNGLPYADVGLPIPRSTMVSYGQAFQKRTVPELENQMVVDLRPVGRSFELCLSDGGLMVADRVVVAVGTSYFGYIPSALIHLPSDTLSHSSNHADLSRFAGQDVTVVGGGSSALDIAAALSDCGAQVRLVVRRPAVAFNSRVRADRSLWQRVRYPVSGIGFGLRSRFYCDAPLLFHYMPEATRKRIVRTFLGPSGSHAVRDRIIGRVPLVLGTSLEAASVCTGGVHLRLRDSAGTTLDLVTHHVIAATGYQVDMRRITFLGPEIQRRLRVAGSSPILSTCFESSVPGLYFVGLASADSFGPMMRFMFGAGYTCRRLSRHLASSSTGRGSYA